MPTLEELRQLVDGWDGPGSYAIHANAFISYAAVVEAFDYKVPAELEPIADRSGGIRMEWDRGNTSFVVELYTDNTMWFCFLGETDDEDEERYYWSVDGKTIRDLYETGKIEECPTCEGAGFVWCDHCSEPDHCGTCSCVKP